MRNDPWFAWMAKVFQLCKDIYAKFNWGKCNISFLFMSIFVLICFVDENNNVKPFQERIISCWWMFATTWRWICVPFKPSARLALPTVSGTGHLIYTFFCYGIQNMK